MSISVGDTLPDGTMLVLGAEGPEQVELGPKLKGRKVVIFGLPGAYTGTCTTAHVPSFIRTIDQLKEKGVDEVICTSVNDPFVMQAWGESTGASDAGITMLADADGAFAKAIGMAFDAPPAGFYGRSQRYALMAEDGVVKVLNAEENPGVCDMSGGEAMVEAI
ncbi:peroxiredoxin [Pelagovum pacificum]|uniref:Glutathione-dependent peroxiredoxin n=1 Tax=Pelagovum pacificum TaxID=2588711 RepID=A0A5C5GHI3_9RHOB|nr:peroxiredoxin [Pelagovum pacificum]QQA42614.1 peroxiredoxin [Pelagovum pacificum]TNY34235.1 peroxiredoxin [Pelagovum pacificum]